MSKYYVKESMVADLAVPDGIRDGLLDPKRHLGEATSLPRGDSCACQAAGIITASILTLFCQIV
jgi:hypothetical protein